MKRVTYFLSFLIFITLPATLFPATQKAPDFVLPDLNGNRVSLRQMQGSKVILLFFSHKHPLNVKTLKQLEIFQKNNPGAKNQPAPLVYAIETTSFPRQVQRFLHKTKINVPVLIDNFQVKTKYNAYAVPKLFVINEKGMIVWKKGGYVNAETIKKAVANPNFKKDEKQSAKESDNPPDK